MRSMVRVATTAALLVGLALTAGPALAQCVPGKPFKAWLNREESSRIKLHPDSRNLATGELFIGRLWQSDDSMIGNLESAECVPDVPPKGWMYHGGPIKGTAVIDGALNANGCLRIKGCPEDSLTILLEEPNKKGDDAFFVLLRAPEEAAAFDLMKLADGFVEHPFPALQRTAKGSGASFKLPSAERNFTGANHEGKLKGDSTIVSWDLYTHAGTTDPGREISDGWKLVQSVPYTTKDGKLDAPKAKCGQRYALGMTFEGGENDVTSRLVGKSILLECN